MGRACAALLFCLLAGCAAAPSAPRMTSACDLGEATYACQIERYNNVNH